MKELLILVLIPLSFIGFIVAFSYDIHKDIQNSEKKDKKAKAEAKLKLIEEKKKPKFRIRFIDSSREEHVSKTYESYITSNPFLREKDERYSIVSSERVAGFALKEAYKEGYIEDVKKNTFPTCNLHKLSIEEIK